MSNFFSSYKYKSIHKYLLILFVFFMVFGVIIVVSFLKSEEMKFDLGGKGSTSESIAYTKDLNFLAQNTLGSAPYSDDRYSLEKVNDNTSKYTNFAYGISFEYDSKFKVEDGIEFVDFNVPTDFKLQGGYGFRYYLIDATNLPTLESSLNTLIGKDLKANLKITILDSNTLEFTTVRYKVGVPTEVYYDENIYGIAKVAGGKGVIFTLESPLNVEIKKDDIKKVANSLKIDPSIKRSMGRVFMLASPKLGISAGLSLPPLAPIITNPTANTLSYNRYDSYNTLRYGAGVIIAKSLDFNLDRTSQVFETFTPNRDPNPNSPQNTDYFIASFPNITNFNRFLVEEIEGFGIKNKDKGNVKFTEITKKQSNDRKDYAITINDSPYGFAYYVFKNNTVYLFFTEKNEDFYPLSIPANATLQDSIEHFEFYPPVYVNVISDTMITP